MALKKDTVIILKSINYSEADKIQTVFGRDGGKFSLIAKGIRKIKSKNRGNMQTFNVCKIGYFEGKNLGILRESELLHGNESFALGKIQMKNTERVLFLLSRFLPEDIPFRKVFDVTVSLLRNKLDTESVSKFRLYALKEFGFIPDYKKCPHCNQSTQLQYLNLETFELYCNDCYNEIQVDGDSSSENILRTVDLLQVSNRKRIPEYIDNLVFSLL